jgi:lysophospholipase L1-like esterase
MTVRLLRAAAAVLAASCALVGIGASTATAAASTAGHAATPVYVALGDSYSSGEGACTPVTLTGCRYLRGTDTATDQCHRSANAYPVRVAARLPKAWHSVFAACSGAVTSDITSSSRFGEPAQLTRLAVGPGKTVRLVTLTIGGNDAGFASAVGACVTAHVFGGSCHGTVTWAIPTATLKARLVATYAAIHKAAPQARVLVVGYPRLFAAKPKVACDLATVDAPAFSKAEDQLNATIAAAVKSADRGAGHAYATFVDNGRTFRGHELCAAPPANAWLNPLELAGGLQAASFHPNAHGQSALANRLRPLT